MKNPNTAYHDEVHIKDIADKNSFSYVDNQNVRCRINIYDDGLCLLRKTNEYELELDLRDQKYAKISSKEGIVKFDVKVLDFTINSDILIMRYLIDDEERIIEIKYY